MSEGLTSSLMKEQGNRTEPTSCKERIRQSVDNYFRITARGSTLNGEFRAGTTAFLATANNFVVNATIMSHAGLPKHQTVISSAFVSGIGCILSGFLSNQPLGLMTSVGPNVFLAYSLVGQGVCNLDEALAISLAAGAILLVFSLTPILQILLGLIPLSVKYGLVMGTGLLIAFIGLKSIGVVVADTAGSNIVALGHLADSPEIMISAVLLVLMSSMIHRAVRGSVLIGMLSGTVAYWFVSNTWPTSYVELSLPQLHSLDFNILLTRTAWTQVFALLLMLLFSISGAVIGCGRMAGLLKEDGGVTGSTAVYVTCGFATMLSAILGSSPVFISMSAAAGIRDGGRTGLVSIVVGMYCMLVAFFFSPLASTMPHCATAPVLVLVGFGMLGEAKEVSWWNTQEALPAFLCAIFQPYTYSVSNGIYAGVGMSFILFFTTGSFLTYFPKRVKDKLGITPEEELTPIPKVPSVPLHFVSSQKVVGAGSPGGQTFVHGMDGSVQVFGVPGSMEILNEADALVDSDLRIESDPRPDSEPLVRTLFTRLQPRQHAVRFMEQGAKCFGLDEEEVGRSAFYKLSSGLARSAEGHWAGGVATVESEAALRSLMQSVDMKAASMQELHAAELMAREAPMVAAQNMRNRHIAQSMQYRKLQRPQQPEHRQATT